MEGVLIATLGEPHNPSLTGRGRSPIIATRSHSWTPARGRARRTCPTGRGEDEWTADERAAGHGRLA